MPVRTRYRPALLLAALLAGGCATAPEPAGTARIGSDALRGGGVWSSGGALRVAVTLRPGDGQARLCGAWTTTPQSVLSRRHNRSVMASGSVSLDGRRLVSGLGFMTRLPEGSALEGAEARCVRVPLDRGEGLADGRLRLHLPPRNFEYDEFSGYLAKFRQTAG